MEKIYSLKIIIFPQKDSKLNIKKITLISLESKDQGLNYFGKPIIYISNNITFKNTLFAINKILRFVFITRNIQEVYGLTFICIFYLNIYILDKSI